MDLDVKHHSADQIYAIWGPVLIRISDGAVTQNADIDRIDQLHRAQLERWPNAAMLLVAHHGNPVPTIATMRYAKALMADIEDRLAVAIVTLGLGFWSEASRTASTWLAKLMRGGLILESTVEAAAAGLALELVGLDAAELTSACVELERRFRGPIEGQGAGARESSS